MTPGIVTGPPPEWENPEQEPAPACDRCGDTMEAVAKNQVTGDVDFACPLCGPSLEPAPVKFGPEFFGCVIDGCGHIRDDDWLNSEIVQFAILRGYQVDPVEFYDDDERPTALGESESLAAIAKDALVWLNEQDLEPDYVFAIIGEGRIRSLYYLHSWASEVGKAVA